MRGVVTLVLAILLLFGGPRAQEQGAGSGGTVSQERVVAGFSRTRVAITTGFSGSEIFVYGAIRRTAPPPEGRLGIVVTVMGPLHPVTVRKRERRFGIWVNGPSVRIDAAPSFYAVATTGDYFETISHTDDMRHRVGLDQVIRLIDAPEWVEDERTAYLEAVVRLMRNRGLYFTDIGGVRLTEDTLFDVQMDLPADIVEGEYLARIFLTRDRDVVDVYETSVAVRMEGLERAIAELAATSSLVYGVLSILVALAAGWAASTLFRLVLPT